MTNEAATTETTAAVAEEKAPETKAPASKKASKPASKKASKPAAKKQPKATKKAAKPAPKQQTNAAGKPASKPKAAAVPREFSKKQIVLDLLSRKDGATMAEIAKATNWQNHSIRGFVSGTLMKKMDLPVESFKNAGGERCYKIAK
jgi:outer membrane biosynthesis protein TonB